MVSTHTCRACLRALRPRPQLTFTRTTRSLHASALHNASPIATSDLSAANEPQQPTRPTAEPSKPATTVGVSSARGSHPPAPAKTPNKTMLKLAESARKKFKQPTETYVAYGATELLVRQCVRQADYDMPHVEDYKVELPKTAEGEDMGVGKGGWWLNDLALPPTFASWTQVSFLHLYLLLTRLRLFPDAAAKQWQQHLLDHFFNLAEDRMITHHRLSSNAVRQKYLKELFAQWRGCVLSYDEGLIRGDAVMAAAVWRNVLGAAGDASVDAKGKGTEVAAGKGAAVVDGQKLAMIVGWMRRELERLDRADDADLGNGQWRFGSPAEEREGVLLESRLMREQGK